MSRVVSFARLPFVSLAVAHLASYLASLALACSALALFAPATANAASYDPALEWRTITTPHFDIHFHEGIDVLGARAAIHAEEAYDAVNRLMGYVPDTRIQMVLADNTESANGSATVLPTPLIRINIVAPAEGSILDVSPDWLRKVIIHEYLHVLHFQMADAIPGALRKILGNQIAVNALSPQWIVEGLAVYVESEITGFGRNASSYAEMFVRMSVLERNEVPIDKAIVVNTDWPGGNAAYLWGGRFHRYLKGRFGNDAIAAYARKYASFPIPFLHPIISHSHFGKPFETLWAEWHDELRHEYHTLRQQLVEEGLTPITHQYTTTGFTSGRAAFDPDRRHIYFERFEPSWGPRAVRKDLVTGEEDSILPAGVDAISVSDDGTRIGYCAPRPESWFYLFGQCYIREERFEVDPANPPSQNVKKTSVVHWVKDPAHPDAPLRARQIELHPNGSDALFVALGGAATGISRIHLETSATGAMQVARVEEVLPRDLDRVYGRPAYAPDGSTFAVSIRKTGGSRDLYLYRRDGSLLAQLTDTHAQEMQPRFTPDQRYLLFTSDRTGIFNIHAFDLATGRLYKVTNVVGGAFEPIVSPDGATLVFRNYTSRGFDVVGTPFNPATFREVPFAGPSVPALPTPSSAPNASQADAPHADASQADAPPLNPATTASPKPYSPLPQLTPFNGNWFLFPAINVADGQFYLGLSTSFVDPLGWHQYGISANYTSITNAFGGSLAYAFTRYVVTGGISLDTFANFFPSRVVTRGGPTDDLVYGDNNGAYIERRFRLTPSVTVPIDLRTAIRFLMRFEHRMPETTLPANTLYDRIPARGNFTRASVALSYAAAGASPFAISRERGLIVTVAADAITTALGGDYNEVVLSAEYRQYVQMPWLRNHVLALKLNVGASFGPDLVEIFRVGGAAADSVLVGGTDQYMPVRGFPVAYFQGNGAYAANLEYRAPIWRIERGIITAPIYFNDLSLAAFIDAGNVWNNDSFGLKTFEEVNVGTGLEMLLRVSLSWAPSLIYRQGFALPLTGTKPYDFVIYFRIGSAF